MRVRIQGAQKQSLDGVARKRARRQADVMNQ
jgi:hypothetical protein